MGVVSTKDPTQRARLPKQSDDSPDDDEFHCSPNEEWIFGLRHVGSGLRYGYLYHCLTPLRIEMSDKDESFNELVWKNCVELGALKEDYSADARCTFVPTDGLRRKSAVCGLNKQSDDELGSA